MAGEAINEGFHYAGEFTCTAIPGPGIDPSRFTGRVANFGFQQSGGPISVTIGGGISNLPSDVHLRSTEQLIGAIEQQAAALSPDELQVIHSIALARLVSAKEHDPAQARSLLELVMREMAQRYERHVAYTELVQSRRDDL